MSWIIQQDAKYGTPKFLLQLYGLIGTHFKAFLNNRRNEAADIIIIAHSKKDDEGRKTIPDVTGQSSQLLLRIADQVGYIYIKNGKRVIQFEPTEETFGKNVAGIPLMEVPDKADPAFRSFGAYLVKTVKDALGAQSEEQREAIAKSEQFQDQINKCEDADALTALTALVNELPGYLKAPLRHLIGEKAKELVLEWNTTELCFEKATAKVEPMEEPTSRTQKWFKDRIGKNIYHKAPKQILGTSMLVVDDAHAISLFTEVQKNEGGLFSDIKNNDIK
jgi:hypothetical protein